MKMRISAGLKELLSLKKVTASDTSTVDVREEYANTLRTESYNEFWTRVLALNAAQSINRKTMGSTTADRLPSYRIFVEHLLDPDQPTAMRILASSKNLPENPSLLFNYFSETANASILCSLLLKDIDHTRIKCRYLKTSVDALEKTTRLSLLDHLPDLPVILTRLTQFSNSVNPFALTASSPHQFKVVQAGCSRLLKQLEKSRNDTQARLKLINKVKHGSVVFLVAFTVSLTVIITTHAFALVVAAPGLILASLDLASTRKLVRFSAQVDAAAKGTYILNRDLDTISRLVARLHDELEHMRAMVRFWLERGEERLQASGEVAQQLKNNNSSFGQQLDELEEHLYLCFMTINRARNLVVKEILDPGKPDPVLNLLST